VTLGRFAGGSDAGRKRRRNEDSFVVAPPLFAVADGMGGAQAGEVASKLAAGAVKGGGSGGVEALIQEANRLVHERSVEDPAASGMGTTLTVAEVHDDVVSIGHVGDSRAYLVRDGSLEQLTEDHSLVGELLRTGKLSPEEAGSHPQRSVITRALGTDPDVDADIFPIVPRAGDLFLLCSDGLSAMVDDREILEVVERNRGDLDRLVKALIKAANKGGGEDNITVIAFEITDGDNAATDLEETAVHPRPAAAEDDADTADTLTELDAVPVVESPAPTDTTVVSADELSAVYEREQRTKPRRRRSDALLVLVVLLVFAALVLITIVGLYR
jgi:PPM family protein phosphatase